MCKKDKAKLIYMLIETEVELKIQATVEGISLMQYIQKLLDTHAQSLRKNRNLTL